MPTGGPLLCAKDDICPLFSSVKLNCEFVIIVSFVEELAPADGLTVQGIYYACSIRLI